MKLQIGGSPCTHWSIAQTKNRETEPSGIGWQLFENYLIALDKFNPDYFLYENNKSVSVAIREEITKRLGVEPICINSALVSAQNRQRLYWTNIPGVQQPEDRGIILRDILQSETNEKGYRLKPLSDKEMEYMLRQTKDGRNHFDFEYYHDSEKEKSSCLTANIYRGVPYNVLVKKVGFDPVRVGTIESETSNGKWDSKQYRVYSPDGKSVTLCGQGGGVGAKTGLYATPVDCIFEKNPKNTAKEYPVYKVRNGIISINGNQYPINLLDGFYIIRKLTVLECMRLQTVPERYVFPVSDTQAYKMLGNGWTVDVIAHIISYCPGITAEPLDVLSMYDGMGCGHLALDKLGAYITRYRATEIDKYAIKTACHNFPDIVQLGDAYQVRENGFN